MITIIFNLKDNLTFYFVDRSRIVGSLVQGRALARSSPPGEVICPGPGTIIITHIGVHIAVSVG